MGLVGGLRFLPVTLAGLFVCSPLFAQLAPTGMHYAGRTSDTGFAAIESRIAGVNGSTIPMLLPPPRGGLPIPLAVANGPARMGAAGLGWDIPLSTIRRERTFARRRPAHGQYTLPGLRERVTLSLLGSNVRLVKSGSEWIAQSGSRAIVVREDAQGWIVYDGTGLSYRFAKSPVFGNAAFWLLKSITGQTGARLDLEYQLTNWPLSGGMGVEVNLHRIAYDFHPSAGCAKHEIALGYGQGATTPLMLSVMGETIFTRFRVLTNVSVNARADCESPLESLRSYELSYEPDADLKLPRLLGVRMRGRQGTPEAQATLPIAAFGYGSATRAGKLAYEITQTIPLPAEDEGIRISGTANDSSAPVAGPGERSAMWQGLIDLTGDGRPELMLRKNGKLWLAPNRPIAGGKTSLTAIPMGLLQDGPLSTHTISAKRFWYGTANRNTVDVWRQLIDVNGDGRLDLIDAAKEPNTWLIYINRPGGPAGVTWEARRFSVTNIGIELASRGHKLPGNYVPLSRRTTGNSVRATMCLKRQGQNWSPYDGNLTFTNEIGTGTYKCDNGIAVSGPALPPLCTDEACPPLPANEPEKSVVEWELNDLNGDGYPDFVFNSLPTHFTFQPIGASTAQSYFVGMTTSHFGLPSNNLLRVAYNVVGVRGQNNEPNPFARSIDLQAPAADRGVSTWESISPGSDRQRQIAGLVDVNGDGLVDRVIGQTAYLGTFLGTARSFLPAFLTLPGALAEQRSDRAQCQSGVRFTSQTIQGLRDLTGDGVPDHIGPGGVSIGTGAGFAPPVPITSQTNFVISHETETCNGASSNTDGGLYDIDGDGKPEIIGLVDVNGARAYVVSQLVGSSGNRALDAGQLTSSDNGYGARAQIRYASAKDDLFTQHQVPFPEIVASAVEVEGTLGLGGALAGKLSAYGRAELVFDSAADSYIFPGYQRVVEVQLDQTVRDRPTGSATVRDRWPLTGFTPTLTKKERWLRQLRVGRSRDTFMLRATADPDPWALLNVDASDPRVIGVTHVDWDAKLFQLPASASGNYRDCFDMVIPTSYTASQADIGGNAIDTCRAYGFAYELGREAWYGAHAPPTTNNVQTATRALEVDDFGRATFVRYENDRVRSDDDICVETRYATATGGYPRNLHAIAARRTTDCSRRLVYANEQWLYDGLPGDRVAAGLVSAHIVDRRATDNGALIRAIRDFDAQYDSLGNRVTMQSARDGAVRTTRYAYDPFGLVPERNTVETIGLPSIETSARYDPISLDTLTITDSNGVARGTRFDGFGRVISNSLAMDGEPEGIVSTLDYRGFDGSDPAGRRIATRRFRDPVLPNLIGSAQATETVIQFDELERPRRAEMGLGADYGGEKLVVSERVYDPRGRIRFEADPYAASATGATAYGTTYHFKTTGEIDCVIRGPGPQPLTEVSNPAAEIYPTCYDHNYVDNVDTLDIRDAASLEAGSSQAGVVHRIVASAVGRVIERSTLKAGVPIALARFNHDRLGQLRSYVRFRDPAAATGPVTWSWRTDSLGQVLQLDETGAASRMLSYSDWGELTETRWQDGAADRRIVSQFDALSRLTASFATADGVVDPATRNDYGYDQPLSPGPSVTPGHLAHRLSWASWPGGNVAFGYDALGGVTSRVFTDEGGTSYIQRPHYDAAGYLVSLAFNLPDNGYADEISKYGYDSAGRLRTIDQGDAGPPRRVFDVEAVDPLGRVLKAHLGGSVVAFQYAPDGRRLLKESIVESSQGSERLIYLRHDALGRELSRRTISDNAADGPKTNIAFDALGRLSQVIRSVGASTQADWEFNYDPLGNVTALKDTIGQADATLSYQTAEPDRVCRVGYGNGGLGGSPADCNVSHDALGNITRYATRDGERQLSYLATGEVSAVSDPGATAALSFDALGSLARLTLSDSLGRPLRNQRFFGGTIEQRDIAGASTILRNIPGPAGLIATRRGASDRWIYEIGERRGQRVFVDQNGEFIQRVDYAPFGEASSTGAAAGSSDRSEHLWNNGTDLEPIGLVQLGQRAYDPVLGRFLSRDPLLTTRDAGRSNPYGFAASDPINNADSTGVDCEGIACQPANPPFLPFGVEYLLRYGFDTSGPPLPKPTPAPAPNQPHWATSTAAMVPKLLLSTPRWLGSTAKYSNKALRFSESGALALARAHMKLRGLLEGMGRPGMRLLDLGARSSMATHWSGGFGLIDLGLRAAGAPDQVTEVTGVLAEANAPAAVFSGWLALGSTTEALIRHGADAGPVIQARNLSGKHTTIVQGYALILAALRGDEEAAAFVTSDEARRGDYGFAIKLGLALSGLAYSLSHTTAEDFVTAGQIMRGHPDYCCE